MRKLAACYSTASAGMFVHKNNLPDVHGAEYLKLFVLSHTGHCRINMLLADGESVALHNLIEMQHYCIVDCFQTLPLHWQVCKSCGEEKPACEFTRYRMRRDGLYNWCKQCDIWKRQERRKRKRDEAYTMTGGMMQASTHTHLA